ncbi:MAG: sugar ABC transporter ATP-binding protein [Tabrizicola sp.]
MPKPILALRSVAKIFGMTAALTGMSLELFPGEVHAIVGENGAGKSTMIKIMTGIYQPTSGHVEIDGAAVSLHGSKAARLLGVAAIYQEPMVFPDLDVAENIFISASRGLWLDRKATRRQAAELMAHIGMKLDVDRVASGLTLAEQQAVEIARALSQNVRVLIMDEPTASLSAHEAAELRRVARSLADQGVAVLYISHRLEEVFELADRVSVIRDGEHISTNLIADTTPQQMIAEMVGREVGNYFTKMASTTTDEVLLSVRDLAVKGVFEGISFDLRRGEILAMAGLIGARRTDVGLALFGITPATEGEVRFKGHPLKPRSAQDAIRAGIAYVSEDRRKLGLAMELPILWNMTLATLATFLRGPGLVDTGAERRMAEDFRKRLNIRTPDVDIAVGKLSGGNQQKVMLAKWLNMNPELLIIDEPTRGIDIGAKAEVHDLIRSFAARGGAVLIISSDLPEVLALGDRILVMREGRQMAIVNHDVADQQRIMAFAMGQEKAA